MDRAVLENLLKKVKGCTFASLDAETYPSPGIRKETRGKRILLFANNLTAGYGDMVERRLIEAGKNPSNFVLGDLPWGERIDNLPLIRNERTGKVYLQVIELAPGEERYFITVGNKEVNPGELNLRERRTNQGLPKGDEVLVNCYNLESIVAIRLMGETLISERDERAILRINVS